MLACVLRPAVVLAAIFIAIIIAASSAFAQPTNDECAAATPITSSGVFESTTAGATGFSSSHCGSGGVNDFFDVWYAFTPTATGVYRFDMALSPGYVAATMVLYEICNGAVLVCDSGPDSGPTAGKPEINWRVNAGQTVYLRIAMCCADQWPFTLRVGPGVLPIIPANDACEASRPIYTGQTIESTNVNATGGLTSGPCLFGFNDNRDVWYHFTAPAAGWYEFKSRGLTSISFNAFYTTLALYDTCDGGQIACGDDYDPPAGSRILRQLAAGEPVNIRVSGYAGGQGTFELTVNPAAAPTPPANDTCLAAREIPSLPYRDLQPIFGATDDTPGSCSSTAFARHGVWYTYVPPLDTNVFILNDLAFPTAVTVFEGSCNALSEVACFRISTSYVGPDGADLVAGRRYWILMAHLNDRDFSADAAVRPRIVDRRHDSCGRAHTLTLPTSFNGQTFIFHNEGTTASCASAQNIDAWHQFVAPAAGSYRFELIDRPEDNLGQQDFPALTLYNTCPDDGGTELACVVSSGPERDIGITRTLAAGERVVLRVAANSSLTGTYALECWAQPAVGTSPNEFCLGALDFSPGVGAKPFTIAGNGASTAQSFTNTFASAAANLASVTLNNDTFYKWVAPADGLLNVRTNIKGFRIAVYGSTACPPAASSVLNATVDDREMSMPVVAGQQLLFQFGGTAPGLTATANLHLSITPYEGACCTPSGCVQTTSTACTGNSTFLGVNTACGPFGPPALTLTDSGAGPIPETTPTGPGLVRTLTAPAAGAFPVAAVIVQTTLNHTEFSDVFLTLSHNGREVVLTHAGDIPNELTGVYIFSDHSINHKGMTYAIGAVNQPGPSGYYRASAFGATNLLDDPTTGFGGLFSAGDWILTARDIVASNRGSLGQWKLTLLPAQARGACPGPGACCRGSSCTLTARDSCTGPNTHFSGAGSTCNPPGNIFAPCCRADFNQSQALTPADIFDYLNAWFALAPGADFNADQQILPSDIFDFLNAWFVGC